MCPRLVLKLLTLMCVMGIELTAMAQVSPRIPGEGLPAAPIPLLLRDDAALRAWVVQRRPDAMAEQARVQQAQAGIDVARLRPNPVLGFSAGGLAVGRRNPPGLPWSDTPNVNVGIFQTVEIGKRGPRIRAATLRRDASREDYRDFVAAAVAEARDAMARVAYLGTRRAILEERLASARSIAELEKSRLDHGDISGTDYDRLLLDAASVEREVAQATADTQQAQGACSTALAASCAAAPADMAVVDAAATLPQAMPEAGRAIAARPDVQSLRLQRDAADADAKLWKRQAIPDPTVGVTYTHDQLTYAGNQPNTLMLSVTMPVPVFDRGEQRARASLGQASELEWQARGLELRSQHEVQALLARRQTLEQKWAQLEQSTLPRSEAVQKSTEVAFRRGGASMTDLLLARREHLNARLELADTRFELFAIRNALRQVLGLDAALTSGTGTGR